MVHSYEQLVITLKTSQNSVVPSTILIRCSDNEGALSRRLEIAEQGLKCCDNRYVDEHQKRDPS